MKRLTTSIMALVITGLNSFSGTSVSHLRCEYVVNPEGIDERTPRLSWVMESEARGQKQTAYRVLVASTREPVDQQKVDILRRITGRVQADTEV